MIDLPMRINERSLAEEIRFDSLMGPFRHATVKMRITKWQRVSLLFKFLCGFLDLFVYEDEGVILKGMHNPKTNEIFLTYIGEKERDA